LSSLLGGAQGIFVVMLWNALGECFGSARWTSLVGQGHRSAWWSFSLEVLFFGLSCADGVFF